MGLGNWLGALNPVAAIANVATVGADLWSAREDRKSQEQMNREQIAYWREQTEYNKPINQMARLKEAGLSPHLAYGQVADAKMGSAPQLTAPQYGRNPLAKLGDFVSLQNVVQQNKLLQAQVKNAMAEAKYTEWSNERLMNRGIVKGDPTVLKEALGAFDLLKRAGLSSLQWASGVGERAMSMPADVIRAAWDAYNKLPKSESAGSWWKLEKARSK